jgi:hypothetical protein
MKPACFSPGNNRTIHLKNLSVLVSDEILSQGPLLLAGTSLGLALISIKSRQVVHALPFTGMGSASAKNRSVFGTVMSQLVVGPVRNRSVWVSGQTSLVSHDNIFLTDIINGFIDQWPVL